MFFNFDGGDLEMEPTERRSKSKPDLVSFSEENMLEENQPPPCVLTLTCQRLQPRPLRHSNDPDDSHLNEEYKKGEFLGRGSFGTVVKAEEFKTGKSWAMKTVYKDQAGKHSVNLLEREIAILKMVQHPHIIYLHEIFENPEKVCLVLELCPHALRDVLRFEGTFSETDTRIVIQRLLSAVSYLHRNGIVHRDLKLENILVGENPTDTSDRLFIKVTDFGLSVVKGGIGHENMLRCFCGTPTYMAPEIIQEKTYSQQCDIWASGVIMHILLSGSPPFVSEKLEELYLQITTGQLKFDSASWSYCSSGARNLLQGMLKLDPAYRLTANEILSHPWILGSSDNTNTPTTVLDLMHQWREELNIFADSIGGDGTSTRRSK